MKISLFKTSSKVVLLTLTAGSLTLAVPGFARDPADLNVDSTLEVETKKHVTAAARFIDPSGALWPSIAFGKPAADTVFPLAGGESEKPVVLEMALTQTAGNQTRRVLGQAFTGDTPPTIQIELSPPQTSALEQVEITNSKGKSRQIDQVVSQGNLRVSVGEKSLMLPATYRYTENRTDKKNSGVFLVAETNLEGSALGLSGASAGPLKLVVSVDARPR